MNKIDKFFTKDVEQFSKLYFNHLKETFDKIDVSEIKNFVDTLLSARERGATIFFMGNGGSAATASHFANDLSFGVNEYKKPFRVVSITDNASVLTALGNDYGYDDIFIRQLRVYGKKDDVVVGVSASGNSKNLVNAFKYSSSVGIKTVALIAFDGGKMKEISDQYLHIPTGDKEYGPAEDLHIIIDHLIANYLMRLLKL
jgi:D-sedoheptulose 7-phosphate isomerase